MLGDFLSILPDFYQIIWHAFEFLWFFCQISQITCFKYLLRITIWSIFSNQEDFFNQILLILFTKGKCFKIMLIYTVTMSISGPNKQLTDKIQVAKKIWSRTLSRKPLCTGLVNFFRDWPKFNYRYLSLSWVVWLSKLSAELSYQTVYSKKASTYDPCLLLIPKVNVCCTGL